MRRIMVTVTGDPCAGKTTLVNHFVDEMSSNETVPTVGHDYFVKEIDDACYGRIEFRIWDTSGDEKFCGASFINTYYRSTNAVLILFDVTSRESFEHVTSPWLARIESACLKPENVVRCLIANKTDLVKRRVISMQEASLFARENNMIYLELSAIHSNYQEVHLPFFLIAKELIDAGVIEKIMPRSQSILLCEGGEDEEQKKINLSSCCH
jgi:small GTP-binding protein